MSLRSSDIELAQLGWIGVGRVVDLVGEPGIGKTRLVDELLTPNGLLVVLRANGGLYSGRTPYFAVSLMLRQHAGIDRSATVQWLVD